MFPMIRKLHLGDTFPRKLLCFQKTSLEVRLNKLNSLIDMLATILWVGNKRLQGVLSKIKEVHEENSFIDSGLRKKGEKRVVLNIGKKDG